MGKVSLTVSVDEKGHTNLINPKRKTPKRAKAINVYVDMGVISVVDRLRVHFQSDQQYHNKF